MTARVLIPGLAGITFVPLVPFPLKKRKIDIAVISDIHLGRPECQAEALLAYLSSIDPDVLVINGNLMDIQSPVAEYFPPTHIQVLRKILNLSAKGIRVYYLSSYQDHWARKCHGARMGPIEIKDQLVLELHGSKTWILPGDRLSMAHGFAGTLAGLGALGCWLLRALNRLRSWRQPGLPATGSKAQEDAFTNTVCRQAIRKGYDTVICGHTHAPAKELQETSHGRCLYLNSGDWISHMTALEYAFKRWKVYRYSEDKLSAFYADEELKAMDLNALLASILIQKEKPLQGGEKARLD